MIGLVVMIGALYWEGLSLAEEKPASGVTEQTQPAAYRHRRQLLQLRLRY